MFHDDVTGSNRAEAREVPAFDLSFNGKHPNSIAVQPEKGSSKVNIMDYAASLFLGPREKEFLLG